MKKQCFLLALITIFILCWMAVTAMADMESMTDDQMGAVQGFSGTIVTPQQALPTQTLSVESQRMDDTGGSVVGQNEKQVFHSVNLDKDVHPGSTSQDVLFSIHVNVDSMTYRTNDTRMVESWSGNRVDFQSLYMDMNQ